MSIKKTVVQIVGITGAISLLMGSPALADVKVTADIFKDKDITVTMDVTKTKTLTITVTGVEANFTGAAEADAIANQRNQLNSVDGVDGIAGIGDAAIFGIHKVATITNSVNDNEGVVGLNQDNSNMVNQGNLVSVAVTNTGAFANNGEGGFDSSATNSQAEAEQINGFDGLGLPTGPGEFGEPSNTVVHTEQPPEGMDPEEQITAVIGGDEGSINDNTGVVGVNQNAGNMNNQLNALAMAVGLGSKFALSEAALGQSNVGNDLEAINTVKSDLITNSVNKNTGVVGVNQSVGNMNNQASVVSMSVLTSTVAITNPGGPNGGGTF
jgi:histidinol phosphatase-like PHP family hydrolase